MPVPLRITSLVWQEAVILLVRLMRSQAYALLRADLWPRPSKTQLSRRDMTDNSAWFALAGALGGILLTGGITLATAILNHRWSEQAGERAHQEQESREAADRLRGVFHDYLVATNAYYHAVHQMHELEGLAVMTSILGFGKNIRLCRRSIST